MRKVKCANCGKLFETNAPNVKYCSPVCKVEGGKTMRKRWESHHIYYNRDYYQAHKPAPQEATVGK